MEWKEKVNGYLMTFKMECSAAETGFVATATRRDGAAAVMEFEQLPDKDDVSTLFISNPEFRKLVHVDE